MHNYVSSIAILFVKLQILYLFCLDFHLDDCNPHSSLAVTLGTASIQDLVTSTSIK